MPNRNQGPVAFTLRPRFFIKRINTQGSVSRVLRTAKSGKIKKRLVPVEKAHQQAGYHPQKKQETRRTVSAVLPNAAL